MTDSLHRKAEHPAAGFLRSQAYTLTTDILATNRRKMAYRLSLTTLYIQTKRITTFLTNSTALQEGALHPFRTNGRGGVPV